MLTAQRLKSLRDQKQLSQEDCAKALGLDRTTYVKYENGGSIKRNVEKLATFFGVSVDYLLGRTNNPTPPGSEVVKGLLGDLGANTRVIEETPKHRILVHASQGLSDDEMQVLIDMANVLRSKHDIE